MPVEFDEENITPSTPGSPTQTSGERLSQPLVKKGFIGWMLRKGIVKNEAQGTLITLAITVICFALMIVIFIKYVV